MARAEQVAPLVGGGLERAGRGSRSSGRAEHGQRDDQPEQGEHTARGHVGRDHGRVGALLGHRQASRED